jgi:hypothetical protein
MTTTTTAAGAGRGHRTDRSGSTPADITSFAEAPRSLWDVKDLENCKGTCPVVRRNAQMSMVVARGRFQRGGGHHIRVV